MAADLEIFMVEAEEVVVVADLEMATMVEAEEVVVDHAVLVENVMEHSDRGLKV